MAVRIAWDVTPALTVARGWERLDADYAESVSSAGPGRQRTTAATRRLPLFSRAELMRDWVEAGVPNEAMLHADGLLAIFFFVAGVELKRELVVGEPAPGSAAGPGPATTATADGEAPAASAALRSK